MKSLYLLILLLLISTVSISQETKKDTLSIEGKFDLIYKTSSSYKEFKVIRKSRFQNLKNDVNEVLGILDLDMKLLITKKNSISFLGIQLNKSTYTITVWSIILLLIIALFYFIYQYKNSYQIILHAKKNVLEAENELANNMKKSLEREQKLRRQLQDEINKQRGV